MGLLLDTSVVISAERRGHSFEDLAIGATALHLGFDVITLNVRHFQLIPSLRVVSE